MHSSTLCGHNVWRPVRNAFKLCRWSRVTRRRTNLVSDGVDEVVDLDVGVDDERLDAAVLQQEVDLHHARWLPNALVRRRLQRLVGRHSPIFLRLTLRFVVVHLRRQLAAWFLRFTFVRLQCTRAFVVSSRAVCACAGKGNKGEPWRG